MAFKFREKSLLSSSYEVLTKHWIRKDKNCYIPHSNAPQNTLNTWYFLMFFNAGASQCCECNMYNITTCTHTQVAVQTYTKDHDHVDKLLKMTRSIIDNECLWELVRTFLVLLCSQGMSSREFVLFMNQPSVTLLPGSKQVPLQTTAEEAIKIHHEHFQWFKLAQLQNCVDMMNNCDELKVTLNKIKDIIFSYIKQGRTELFSNEKRETLIVFRIDPAYEHFKMTDLYLMEECINLYFYHKKYKFKLPLNIQYWVYKYYKSSFIGTHPIREEFYDSTRSSFVSPKQYGLAQDVDEDWYWTHTQNIDASSYCYS